jgi:hypothetical protein
VPGGGPRREVILADDLQAERPAGPVGVVDADHSEEQGHRRPGPATTAGVDDRVNWHEPDERETAAAVAEFACNHRRQGRRARPASLALGTAEGKGREYQAKARAVARLCRLAGADEKLIPAWTEEGRRRANAVRPPSGAPRRIRPGQHPPSREG